VGDQTLTEHFFLSWQKEAKTVAIFGTRSQTMPHDIKNCSGIKNAGKMLRIFIGYLFLRPLKKSLRPLR
jgi:hypothetical protein